MKDRILIKTGFPEKLNVKEVDFMDKKIPVVPDPETVKPPLVPTIPAPVPIPMPRPERAEPGNKSIQKENHD